MICVYPADCTDFSTNGLGVISPLSAEVTETLSGEYVGFSAQYRQNPQSVLPDPI